MTLARPDLAANALEGVARADAYAETSAMRVAAPSAWISAAPTAGAEHVDQLLFGERFDVLATDGDFAWGQARRDGYVGFVERRLLGDNLETPSHWLAVRCSFAFAEPSVRATPFGPLSMNALLTVAETEGAFVRIPGAGWVAASHVEAIGVFRDDPASIAEAFAGAAYLWGGREADGLDCSGLIQQALQACGLAAPRDTDQQATLGIGLAAAKLRRGDLVAWKGHIGIMLDAECLLHANAHHMAVASEPLAEAVGRIAAAGHGQPIAYRRPLLG